MNKQKSFRAATVRHVPVLLSDFSRHLIEELHCSGRYSTARAYSSSVRRFLLFGGEELSFGHLTPSFLKRYEEHLFSEGCRHNTVSLYLRMLRALCNRAARQGLASFPSGLFDGVFTGTDGSNKRAIPASSVKLLRDADLRAVPHIFVLSGMVLPFRHGKQSCFVPYFDILTYLVVISGFLLPLFDCLEGKTLLLLFTETRFFIPMGQFEPEWNDTVSFILY